jgi:hypothetical protein
MEMHGATVKVINAQQARLNNIYKSTKLKLLKVNASIWFNKICREKQLKPNYISIKVNGRRHQDIRTTAHAIQFRINQEIKFLYKKKQHLNQQLYKKQLECAHLQNGMWQHIQYHIDQRINNIMENQYQKLNKKLDALSNQTHKDKTKQKVNNFQPRVINLSNIHFTKEQIQTLSLGPNFAIEMQPKRYINALIVDTENAIRQLEPKMQNVYRHLAAKQIQHIVATNRHNIFHKRQQYNLIQIKKILKNNNLITVKADKTKAIVIIDNEQLKKKVNKFITENQMQLINKDPTEVYQKQIHQTIQKCNTLIDKHIHKYLTNIKPSAPQLNAYIKTHKENQPIRPVINNTQAPSYKAARYINKKLQSLIKLPYTYNTSNSQEIAEELTKLQINENMRIVTLDIKDMYANLPIKGIIKTIQFWLNIHNNSNKDKNEQLVQLLNTIMNQNYF